MTGPIRESNAVPAPMPERDLGRTGHRVRIFSLGGQSAIEQPNNEANAIPLIERALDLGVNYLDTAPRYGGAGRWSQRYLGKVMKRRRREAFLATKTHDRSRDGSLRLLEESLRLLQTDHVDLWQLHKIDEMEEVERIFGRGGAIEAMIEAREQGLVRFLGLTGHHDPEILIEAMRRHDFDTILMAINAADTHHRSFAERLLPLAVDRGMGIIGMKVPARGELLKPRGPLTMDAAMRYVLSLPVSTIIVGCDDVAQLEENVAIARAFTPFDAAERAAIEASTRPVAARSLSFRRWP